MAAASGSSLQQVFDKPLIETKTSPFDSILSKKPNTNPIKPDHRDSCSSFPDMFTNNINKSTKHTYMNAESLVMCTEGLGFESFRDVEDLKKEDQNLINDHQSYKQQHETKNDVSEMIVTSESCEPKRSRIRGMEFPPLISSLGSVSCKKPIVCLKSFRSEGRFILKEVLILNHELLHACREDGRLKLHFVLDDEDDEHDQAIIRDIRICMAIKRSLLTFRMIRISLAYCMANLQFYSRVTILFFFPINKDTELFAFPNMSKFTSLQQQQQQQQSLTMLNDSIEI